MEKVVITALIILSTWLIAIRLGWNRYYSVADGVAVRRNADLAALILGLAGLGLTAYLITSNYYGDFLLSALYISGNIGEEFYLNNIAAIAMVAVFTTVWLYISSQLYRLGSEKGAFSCLPVLDQDTIQFNFVPIEPVDFALTPVDSPRSEKAAECDQPESGDPAKIVPLFSRSRKPTTIGDDGKPQATDLGQVVTRIDDDGEFDAADDLLQRRTARDLRLAKSFPCKWVIGDTKCLRYHKDPRSPEVHLNVDHEAAEMTGGIIREGVLTTIETNELAHPHIWAQEIAGAMRFAGWKGSLQRIPECESQSFVNPNRGFRVGYAAELKFAAEAKTSSDQPHRTISAAEIAAFLKAEGVKLRRAP